MGAQFDGGRPPVMSGKKLKHLGIAYLLLIGGGMFGAHRFYVGAYRSAILLMLMTVTAVICGVTGAMVQEVQLGWVVALLIFAWLLLDLALIVRLIAQYNSRQSMRWDA